MNIKELAALVTVRNHINLIMNDKTVTSKNDFAKLNSTRNFLDKEFIKHVCSMTPDNLVPKQLTIVKVGSKDYKPTPQDLEHWRKLFADAEKDQDFTIFTHPDIEVYSVERGDELKVLSVKAPEVVEVPKPPTVEPVDAQLSLPLLQVSVPTPVAIDTPLALVKGPAGPTESEAAVGANGPAGPVDEEEDKRPVVTDEELLKRIAEEKAKLKKRAPRK